ncbi:MAG: endonuclease/exonuclease/phosphatase family protein, partial [Mediterraneibacter gnavus]
MKTNSKKWLKRLGIFLGTLILIVVGYVVYVFSSYYRLEDKQKLTITGKSTEKAKIKKSYRITSGNIGFGAYSDDYSFFMDGGKESRARSKDAVIENVSSYAKAVAQLNPDFMLFQEVDIDGTRSYHVDERK